MEQINYTYGCYQDISKRTYKHYQFTNDSETEFELNDLYNCELSLIKPFPIKLNPEAGCFIFVQEELNLWGEGNSLKEAERELAMEIIRLFKRLSSLKKNELGPYPKKQLSFLRKFIEPVY